MNSRGIFRTPIFVVFTRGPVLVVPGFLSSSFFLWVTLVALSLSMRPSPPSEARQHTLIEACCLLARPPRRKHRQQVGHRHQPVTVHVGHAGAGDESDGAAYSSNVASWIHNEHGEFGLVDGTVAPEPEHLKRNGAVSRIYELNSLA